jgi:hypothetical protein
MDLIQLLRRLQAAEGRRAAAPRMSDEYFRAAAEVDELSRQVWAATRDETPVAARRRGRGTSSSTVLPR